MNLALCISPGNWPVEMLASPYPQEVLIQPRCQISKMLYGKSIPYNYLRTKPSSQIITNSNQPSRRVTQVRNREQMNHLLLMIFIWLHSEYINLLNNCLFCSIVSLYIQKPQFCLCVFFSNPQAQTQSQQADKKSKLFP